MRLMDDEELRCWRCGESLAGVMQPISRLATCPACQADLHVCLFCRFHAPRVIGECDHDRAEPVEIKNKSNFCGHFRPNPGAHDGSGYTANDEGRRALDALFDSPMDATARGDGASDAGAQPPEPKSESERARRELDQLFGLSRDADD